MTKSMNPHPRWRRARHLVGWLKIRLLSGLGTPFARLWATLAGRVPVTLTRVQQLRAKRASRVNLPALSATFCGTCCLKPVLEEQVETAWERFAALVGRNVDLGRRLQILCYAKRDDYYACAGPIGAVPGLCEPRRRRITLCEEVALRGLTEPSQVLRSLLAEYLLAGWKGAQKESWLVQGIQTAVAVQPGHSPTVWRNRRLRHALAAGRHWDATTLRDSALWRHHSRNSDDLDSYLRIRMFTDQTWSLVEFLGGETSDWRHGDAFHELMDLLRVNTPVDRALHACYDCGLPELLRQWLPWADALPIDGDSSLSGPVRRAFVQHILPIVQDDLAPQEARIAAMRVIGEHSILQGAPALVQLLRSDSRRLRTEAAHALELISGESLGMQSEPWETWCRGQATQFSTGTIALIGGNP